MHTYLAPLQDRRIKTNVNTSHGTSTSWRNSNDERNTSKIRKKAAKKKIKKIELVRFLATAPKTESTQQKEIRFEELLDKCFVGKIAKRETTF